MPPMVVGVDIGGTKIVAGVVDRAGCVVDREDRATPERTAPAQVVATRIPARVAAVIET